MRVISTWIHLYMDPLTSAELSSDFIKPKANFLRPIPCRDKYS